MFRRLVQYVRHRFSNSAPSTWISRDPPAVSMSAPPPATSQDTRPFADLSTPEVKRQYVQTIKQARDTPPTSPQQRPVRLRAERLREEWRHRGHELAALREAVADAGCDANL